MIKNIPNANRKLLLIGLEFSCLIGMLFVVPLFINRDFYSDWFRNVWIIQYYGEYFKSHHEFPDVINSIGTWKYVSQVGMMHPIYYGQWIYRILGFICAIIPYGSARKAILISIFILTLGEAYSWFKLSYCKSNSIIISTVLSAAIVLAPYTVSNMYLTNTIPQHYAFSCIMTAIPVWMLSFEDEQNNYKNRMPRWLLAALLVAVAAGSHPITALLGGTFFLVLVVITLIKNGRKISKAEWIMGISLIVVVLGCLANWLYSVLTISSNAAGFGKLVYIAGRDSLLNRLRIIPFNYETAVNGVRTIISPYASYQISIPILLLMLSSLGCSIYTCKKKINIAGILLLILYILLLGFSCNYAMGQLLPDIVGVIQFPTRLIYYVDAVGALCVLINLESIQKCSSDNRCSRFLKYVSTFAIGIVLCGFVLNGEYINTIEGVINYDASDTLLLTNGFYNADDYASLGYFGEEIEVDDGGIEWADGREYYYPVYSIEVSNEEFGSVNSTEILLSEDGYVGINMYQHPWNSLYIDGTKVDNSTLRPDIHHEYVFVNLIRGEHKLEYRFEPPMGFFFTKVISYVCMGLLIVSIIFFVVLCLKSKKPTDNGGIRCEE